ncbi:MAG: hypothetical protein ACT4PQ_00445 [Betaproteobacteria bacterium]
MSRLANIPAVPAVLVCLLSFGAEATDIDSVGNDRPASTTNSVAQSTLPWPTLISADGSRFVIYQPQFDKWEGDRLEGRAAVAVHAQGDEQPSSFGMVWILARTETNRAGAVVTIRDLAITKVDFPTATDRADDYVELLRRRLAAKTWQVPLERLQTDMAIDRAAQQASRQPLRNEPPKIIFSERPAILVPIDGAPVLREVAGTGLQRIVNTRALILYDPAPNNPVSARYYLYVIDHWRQAQHLAGPWTTSASLSADFEKARQLAVQEDQVDLLDEDVEDGEPLDTAAAIYVSTEPTELLQTDGSPQYAPIDGTQLLFVTNSPNQIFLDLRTASHYVLFSGRWYRARALQRGPWEYVAAASLPGDFALIPPAHATAPVRAAVPGTPQAREAVIANGVPQVATVTRSAASLELTYDGDPSFQPIPGTSLQTAVNAPIPVIRVSEESFFALDNGVWFAASSPFGPWSAASYVPAVIYSIPRSSPFHYVTYVRIYDATPEVVYVGYTAGYVGSYVSSDLVVVYGSGWTYRPWIGAVWYGYPVTWGFGFSIVYNWWNPWQPCCFAAWAPHPHYRPWWGPWHYHAWHHRPAAGSRMSVTNIVTVNRGHRSHNVTNIYDRWDRKAVHAHARDAIERDHGARQRVQAPPGNRLVAGTDGRRHLLGERSGGRDWKDMRADARNRADLPPIRRGDSIDRDHETWPHAQPRPGDGFVTRNDGRRQELADRRGRNWKDSGAAARNRADLPPIQRHDSRRPEAAERRDLAMNQWRDSVRREPDGRSNADMPRVQTPSRRSGASIAPIDPGHESSQAARPRSEVPLAGPSPRPRQDFLERQPREPAMTRRQEPDRAQLQFRPQQRQFAEPLRVPDRASESAPREWRQDRAAPSVPSAGVAPARPQVLREQGVQAPRVIPDAREPGGALRERVERGIGDGAGRAESRPQFRGGERSGHMDRRAGPPGPRFGERQR